MKNLSIKFIGKKPIFIKKAPYLLGQITIGDFQERFDIAIKWWSITDYESQWHAGLERLKDNDYSCLVAEVYDPNKNPTINWWLIYKTNNMLHIRNELLFGDRYRDAVGVQNFTPENCYDFIGPKGPQFSDGRELSEWIISYDPNSI